MTLECKLSGDLSDVFGIIALLLSICVACVPIIKYADVW